MMLVPTHLRPSPIHGLGVYAAGPIPAGTRIWELRLGFDMLIDLEDFSAFPPLAKDFVYRYCYPHRTLPNKLVLETDHGRFLNHGLPANTDFTDPLVGYARVDIAAGEELLCDYDEICEQGYTLMP